MNNMKANDAIFEIHQRDGYRSRARCTRIDCPYFDAETIPNYAIVLESFSDKEKSHIKNFHHSC